MIARTVLVRFLRVVLLLLISFALAFEALTFVRIVPYRERAPKILFIRPHTPPGLIARELSEAGVLESRWKFKLLVRLTGAGKKLKPGEYNFFVPSSPLEIVRTLTGGKVILHRVTVPEGLTVADIGRVLAGVGLMNATVFEDLVHDPGLAARVGVPSSSFEGFLFPDTYYFSKLDDPETMLRAMHDRFRAAISPGDEAKAKALGLSLVQWVTLASMIEKESGVRTEQPVIASVFINRLRKKMRLQSDPTVIYGIPGFNGNLTKKNLQTPTPYNTYTNAGLPPGPIANPGEGALKAAVNPAQTNYLYFVARQDGTHAFSATYEEHLGNVNVYQLHRPPPVPTPMSLPRTDRTPRPR
jgi:UPF0755 protein